MNEQVMRELPEGMYVPREAERRNGGKEKRGGGDGRMDLIYIFMRNIRKSTKKKDDQARKKPTD